MNGKVMKLRNKSCGEQATIKVSESTANPRRLEYKYEKLRCDYFRWWEPFGFEYKVIVRE